MFTDSVNASWPQHKNQHQARRQRNTLAYEKARLFFLGGVWLPISQPNHYSFLLLARHQPWQESSNDPVKSHLETRLILIQNQRTSGSALHSLHEIKGHLSLSHFTQKVSFHHGYGSFVNRSQVLIGTLKIASGLSGICCQ